METTQTVLELDLTSKGQLRDMVVDEEVEVPLPDVEPVRAHGVLKQQPVKRLCSSVLE